jgi:hypothetical protein
VSSDRFVLKDGKVIEKERPLPISDEKEVVIAGGGMAGVAAAIAAARNGAKTLLIERFGFLGGVATAGLMYMAFAPLNTTSGIGRELFLKMLEQGGTIDDTLLPFDPEQFKYVALKTAAEAGVDFLFHSIAAGTVTLQDKARGVIVENKSGRSAILSRVLIDATGDGDVAAMAGAPFIKGREKDGMMRPVTLLFRVGGIDVEKLVRYVKENPSDFTPDPFKNVLRPEKDFYRLVGFFSFMEEAKRKGEIDSHLHYVRVECLSGKTGMAMINTTRVYQLDGTNASDITKGELAARKQMMELMMIFRKYFPGFEKSFLIDSASMLGIRETRHILGDYILTGEDIAERKKFPKVIARSATRVSPGGDVHSPDGTEGSIHDKRHRGFIDELTWCSVPYDSLLPREVENLLVAGRCISADHIADGWTRIQTCCMATGEAAGTAAALSVKNHIVPRKIEVGELQAVLRSQGVDLND